MNLSKILEKRTFDRVGAIPDLKPTPVTAQIAKLIRTQDGGPRAPDPDEAKAALYAISEAVAKSDWSVVSRRQFRRAPYGIGNAAILENLRNKGVLESYLARMDEMGGRLANRALVRAYIVTFDASLASTDLLADYFRGNLNALPQRLQDLHQSFNLFTPSETTSRIARAALSADDPIAMLYDAGIDQPFASGGLAHATFISALNEVRQRFATQPSIDAIDQLSRWFAPDGRLEVIAERHIIIDTLLMPFVENDPGNEIRRHLQNLVLRYFKDPRIHPANWRRVDPAACMMLRRWLAGRTLDIFLDIVSRIAPQHQWDRRRRFWRWFIDNDYVTDAWVILGRQGVKLAQSLAQDIEDPTALDHGKLIGGNTNDQTILLLRVGSLVVAEGSHNRKLRIWRDTGERVPVFYKSEYGSRRLMIGNDYEVVHDSKGRWRQRTADFIYSEIGARITIHEYGH